MVLFLNVYKKPSALVGQVSEYRTTYRYFILTCWGRSCDIYDKVPRTLLGKMLGWNAQMTSEAVSYKQKEEEESSSWQWI